MLHLTHIIEAGEAIVEYTAGGREEFRQDRKTRDAVVRNLEIIGEAAKRLSDTLRSENTQVPWRDIAGLRDIVIHQYDYVDYNEVWRIIEQDLQGLLEEVRGILAKRQKNAP